MRGRRRATNGRGEGVLVGGVASRTNAGLTRARRLLIINIRRARSVGRSPSYRNMGEPVNRRRTMRVYGPSGCQSCLLASSEKSSGCLPTTGIATVHGECCRIGSVGRRFGSSRRPPTGPEKEPLTIPGSSSPLMTSGTGLSGQHRPLAIHSLWSCCSSTASSRRDC